MRSGKGFGGAAVAENALCRGERGGLQGLADAMKGSSSESGGERTARKELEHVKAGFIRALMEEELQ